MVFGEALSKPNHEEAGMIRIVKAGEEHLPGIIERWIELLDYHAELDPIFTGAPDGHVSYREYVRKFISEPTACVLVALDGDNVIGFAVAMIANYPPPLARRIYGYISDVAVTQTHRGRGIGADMARKVLDWFTQQGITRVELRVSSYNDVALSFWERHGFREYMKIMHRELGDK
jgi:ribosomal protein S18 acetylase RimI-like enzyme